MTSLITILICLIAFFHVYVLWLEMFAWTTRGKKVFRNIPDELFEKTKVMAANQGLYNGFLAAGLVWSLLISDPSWQTKISGFFLSCVAIAGLYGAFSVSKKILFVQGIPAIITLILLLFS